MAHEGSTPLYRILGSLERVKKSGSGYEACCPGPRHKNADKNPSLSIGLGQDGRVLLNCHAGCDVDEVLSSLNMTMSDLFEHSQEGNPVRRYRLLNSNGATIATHVREDLPGDKKIHWERNGHNGLDGMPLENMPLYRTPDLITRPHDPVIVCEGEKAAEALVEAGLLALGTVTGAAGTPSVEVLSVLNGRVVWLWPDNDKTGREHMQRIAERLKVTPLWVEWKDAPEGGDAADYIAQGGTAAGIQVMVRQPTTEPSGPRIWRGDELTNAHFDPVRWAIPGILPSGLTILAGRPKLGKSWLVLGWALDVARGYPVLKKIETQPGDTLYLALEDSPRRMQERQAMMLGETPPSHAVHIATSWPRQNEGGLEMIEQWIVANPRARLVMIDTFKRFRPKEMKLARLYDLDYDAVAPLAELAGRHNIAVVLVLHTNKTDPSDPIDLVSGTLGLAGAADGVLVLKRERGQADASLFVTGRDVEEQDLALKWDKLDTFGWMLLGEAEQFRMTKERSEVLNVIAQMPGLKPSEIAAALGKTSGPIRRLLFKMVRDEEVRLRDERYWPAGNSGHSGNEGNSGNGGNAFEPVEDVQDPKTEKYPFSGNGNSGNGGPTVTHSQGHGNALPVTAVTTITTVTTETVDTAVTAQGGERCERCGRSEAVHGPGDPLGCAWLAEVLCSVHHVSFDAHECDAL